MKNWIKVFPILLLVAGCTKPTVENEDYILHDEHFNMYWYDGLAEINTYQLQQARYGEFRKGTAVMIFVTEPFSKQNFTKADTESDKNTTVLKLNMTKNFITGVYPYSLMTSVFTPVDQPNQHAIKISNSTQEWCGQTYMEMIREGDFDISVQSYFEGESKAHHHEEIGHLEDDIWNQIRLQSEELPTGEFKMIPSFNYLRLHHKKLDAYACNGTKSEKNEVVHYELFYPDLNRKLKIVFEASFPHKIIEWTESIDANNNGNFDIESKATLMESIKLDYWNKKSVADTTYRDSLNL